MTTHFTRRHFLYWIVLLVAACVGIVGSVGMTKVKALILASQTPSRIAPSNGPLAFDVVSIHPSKQLGGFKRTSDGYQAIGEPLYTTIMMAYFPFPIWSPDRLKNAPSWVMNERYSIDAKVAPEDLPAWQKHAMDMTNESTMKMMQTMLQDMLAERCKLVVHSVPAQVSGYVLVTDKKGAKLKPSPADELLPDGARVLPDGSTQVYAKKDGTEEWVFSHASIASLVGFLEFDTRGAVQDKTGLSGTYDFVLRKPSFTLPGGAEPPTPGFTVWDIGALGLRLVPAKIQTETLAIDHIERPSAN